MHVLILTRSPRAHATRRLFATGRERGHSVTLGDPLTATVRLSRRRPDLYLSRQPVTGVDSVLVRFGAALTRPGLTVVRQLEQAGSVTVNSADATARARDKLRSLQLLIRHDIDMPATAFVNSIKDVRFAIDLVGGPPVVVKSLEGMQGSGVMLAETVDSAVSLVEALTGVDQPVMVQRFVRESAGVDVRAFVVGDRVVAAMRRHAEPGEFRANASLGARVEPIQVPPEIEAVAVNACAALGLVVGGVDLLEADAGPMLLEVNAAPGFEALETATGADIASAIYEHLERLAAAAVAETG